MTSLGEIKVRAATVADAADIAHVHVESWRTAYAGIVPDEYLASLDPATREHAWVDVIAEPARRVWVAQVGGRTVGFACLSPSRDEDAGLGDLEIRTMYLEPEAWGHGVARHLMRTLLGEVPSGVPVTLWVLADAARGRHFYHRHGFSPDGVERREVIGGKDLTVIRMRHPGAPAGAGARTPVPAFG